MDVNEPLDEGHEDVLPEEEENEALEALDADSEDEVDSDEEGENDEVESFEYSDDVESDEDGIYLELDGEELEPVVPADTISTIRQANRKLNKENKELERRLAELEAPEVEKKLGAKPKLEDFDYDTDEFEKAILSWNETKREVEAEEAKAAETAKAQAKAWQDKIDRYVSTKAKVKNDNFELVESLVEEKLSQEQQNLILASSDNAVHDVWSLGMQPEELERLAKIDDHAKFIYELGVLQGKRGKKMANKPKKPEKRVKGSAPKGNAVKAKLKELQDQAALTGDRTEVVRYKRKHGIKS